MFSVGHCEVFGLPLKTYVPTAMVTATITETFNTENPYPDGWYGDHMEVFSNQCGDNTFQLRKYAGEFGFKMLVTKLNQHYRVRYKICNDNINNLQIAQWPTDGGFDLIKASNWNAYASTNPNLKIDGIQFANTNATHCISFDFTAIDTKSLISIYANNDILIGIFMVEDLTLSHAVRDGKSEV